MGDVGGLHASTRGAVPVRTSDAAKLSRIGIAGGGDDLDDDAADEWPHVSSK